MIKMKVNQLKKYINIYNCHNNCQDTIWKSNTCEIKMSIFLMFKERQPQTEIRYCKYGFFSTDLIYFIHMHVWRGIQHILSDMVAELIVE